jgi:hypothetical protein
MRTLRAAPGFTVVALIVLAFGIGASTLIFSTVDAVVLRALPFDEPDRIVSVGSLYSGHPGLETAATFVEWRERQTAFEALTAIDDGVLVVTPTVRPKKCTSSASRLSSSPCSVCVPGSDSRSRLTTK